MTCLVKVLEVERVVASLVYSGSSEIFSAYFELEHKDHVSNDGNRVNSLPEAWDGIFEIDMSGILVRPKYVFENLDLDKPRVALRYFKGKLIIGNERA